MPEATIVCRIAFSTAPFAASPTWSDVSSDVIHCMIRRGRQHELDRMEAGTAQVRLLNISGDYWPDNASGSYYPNVKPVKRINIRATYNDQTYDLYTGFIEDWQPNFILKPIKGPVMDLPCSDLIKNLSRLFLNDATGYSEELSGTRVGNVLDDLGWPAGNRDIDAGQSNIQATGELVDVNALDHLFTVQQSESGILYIAPDGDVQFEDRGHRLASPHNTSQATFGDDAGEMKYHRIELVYGDRFLYNDIRITRNGGTQQSAEDSTSQDNYGKRTLTRSKLLITADTEALSQAQYLLSRFKEPYTRVKKIVIRPDVDPDNLYPKVLSYDIGTRVTIRLNQASIDEDYFIEGIEHRFEPDKPWQTTWELSKADNQQYWALGVEGYSELGETTKLFY